ncbi:IS3 family transposase [Rhodococcus erythropolis]|uniref:IS3 family transposase n=1 Tax=Rhodococcus erythropolis TaxID=1833 RepID=UPI00355745D5
MWRNDNAPAEAFNSLFKVELVRNKGPWRSIGDLEIAVVEYIDWFNHRRMHGEIGMIPPVESEQSYYHSHKPRRNDRAGRREPLPEPGRNTLASPARCRPGSPLAARRRSPWTSTPPTNDRAT